MHLSSFIDYPPAKVSDPLASAKVNLGFTLLRPFLVVILLSVSGALGAAQTPGARSATESIREQSNAVVLLEPLDDQGRQIGQGSGFVVTSNGAIVTNLHVIQGAATIRVKLASGDVYNTADVVDFDQLKDSAVIKIRGFQLPVVKLGDSDRVATGDSIVAISSPEGLTNSLTTGVISGIRRLETHRVFQITAPIGQGSSGGALFDHEGSVVGITTYILRSGQNINFALPINYVRGMISDRVTNTVASLPKATGARPAVTNAPSPAASESVPADAEINNATRRRLGTTSHEPMFIRTDEALALFFRLVEGIGRSRFSDVEDATRTAALIKTRDTDTSQQYIIKYLSFHQGVALNFKKPAGLLESVELLVNWSLSDLERSYGTKHKKRTIDGESTLEFKKTEDKLQVHAFLDGDGNVRAVRFTKVK